MNTGTAVKVNYWTAQNGPTGLWDFEGIQDFRQKLDADYISVVQSRPGGLGGLHELYVEFISPISLSDVARLLLDGTAFDLIKSGTKAFVLRPFLTAYKKLREKNTKSRIDIAEFRVIFKDSVLIIRKISAQGIFSQLEKLLLAVAEHYDKMILRSGESPFAIHIPVFQDPAEHRVCRFRVIGDIDETIKSVGPSDYFEFWGLEYDYSRALRVYDVARKLLIDEEFFTLERYWAELRKRENPSGQESRGS